MCNCFARGQEYNTKFSHSTSCTKLYLVHDGHVLNLLEYYNLSYLSRRSRSVRGFCNSEDFFHNRQFCRFIFNNQWVVYGGGLNGCYQSFIKVIFKKLTSVHGHPIFSKSPWIGAAQIRSFDSYTVELSSEYRVGEVSPKM
jgi:hypothetical protein